MNTHILSIDCPDERGLIYKITGVIFKYNLNIVSNSEFVERNFNQFFMRTEFSGEFDRDTLLHELQTILPATSQIKLTVNSRKNIIIMATKEYHCLSDLLVRYKFNDLHANVLAVISNHQVLEDLTAKFDVPYYFIDHQGKTITEHEDEIMKVIVLP